MFVPKGFDNKKLSSIVSRESADQAQVLKLKALSYEAAVDSLLSRYAN